MARSKKVKRGFEPPGKRTLAQGDPDAVMSHHPSWNFRTCDKEMWPLTGEQEKALFWDELLPRLQDLESQTWSEIIVGAKKQNHSIVVEDLNKVARDRLAGLFIEAESVVSLRVTSTHRLYGYRVGATFHILWYDLGHGDNSTCVCRSHLKNT